MREECNEHLKDKQRVEWRESEDRYYDVMPYADNFFNNPNYYVNASPITINTPFEFIASQGPMAGTLESFLDLIIDKKVNRIFMVTNLFEKDSKGNKIPKCEQYWAEPEETREIGKYILRTESL